MKTPMVMRSVRVLETLWDSAKETADARGENLSDVIRETLEQYVEKGLK